MSTDDGQNLLEPGSNPHENFQFLTMVCAVVKAIDDYAELLRLSAATPGNDHRLGANEAPPAIISIFLGDQLTDIFTQLQNGGLKRSLHGEKMLTGVKTLPDFNKDSTDRNSTSPFAFTGNKFEFRMVASSQSISGPNVVLNLIVAEVLSQFADRLEKATDFDQALKELLAETAKKHNRVLFDGNGYSDEWVEEATKRGLPNITSTVEADKVLKRESIVELYEKHKVLNRTELESRYEINLEQYSKQINIEALTMIDMAKHQILPAAIKYSTQLAQSINTVKAASNAVDVSVQANLLQELSSLMVSFKAKLDALENSAQKATALTDAFTQAEFYRDAVFKDMQTLRLDGDMLEAMIDTELWPLPSYAQMLFML